MKKLPIEAEDLDVLFDKLWKQFSEDRESIKEVFEDLRTFLFINKHNYADSGDTLAKLSDVMIKQTGQLIELIKLAQKSNEKNDRLDDEDLEKIHKEINKDES